MPSLGRQTARAGIDTIKAGTATRALARAEIAAAAAVYSEWLARYDSQVYGAEKAFAASRTAQFATFVAALPDVVLDPDPVP